MKEEKASSAKGVMHCFTETYEMAKQAIEQDFYISFSGIITFKNAESLRETVKKIPLDRILIETDSPYLAPVPNRGKLNEPANVVYVAQKIAEIKNISIEEVAETTTKNFFSLFSKCRIS
jgi:TatD DNase family protein